MKCQVTSNTTHEVLLSKKISSKSYKETCIGEIKKVNLGFGYKWLVEDNELVHSPREVKDHIYGKYTSMVYDWEILSKFFSMYNIEPNWLDCNETFGHYDDEQGGWTGCMGQV